MRSLLLFTLLVACFLTAFRFCTPLAYYLMLGGTYILLVTAWLHAFSSILPTNRTQPQPASSRLVFAIALTLMLSFSDRFPSDLGSRCANLLSNSSESWALLFGNGEDQFIWFAGLFKLVLVIGLAYLISLAAKLWPKSMPYGALMLLNLTGALLAILFLSYDLLTLGLLTLTIFTVSYGLARYASRETSASPVYFAYASLTTMMLFVIHSLSLQELELPQAVTTNTTRPGTLFVADSTLHLAIRIGIAVSTGIIGSMAVLMLHRFRKLRPIPQTPESESV